MFINLRKEIIRGDAETPRLRQENRQPIRCCLLANRKPCNWSITWAASCRTEVSVVYSWRFTKTPYGKTWNHPSRLIHFQTQKNDLPQELLSPLLLFHLVSSQRLCASAVSILLTCLAALKAYLKSRLLVSFFHSHGITRLSIIPGGFHRSSPLRPQCRPCHPGCPTVVGVPTRRPPGKLFPHSDRGLQKKHSQSSNGSARK